MEGGDCIVRAHVDEAALAELRHEPAGLRDRCARSLVCEPMKSVPRRAGVARPIRETATASCRGFELPLLRAAQRIERKHAVLRRHIHRAVDDQRRALEEAALVAGVEGPRALQLADVAGVDLIERRVFRLRPDPVPALRQIVLCARRGGPASTRRSARC